MDQDFGINQGLVEELYAQYVENPDSVDLTWRKYFQERLQRAQAVAARRREAGQGNGGQPVPYDFTQAIDQAFAPTYSNTEDGLGQDEAVLAKAAVHGRVYQLLNAYRVRGHYFAHIDPLDLPQERHHELELENFGLSESELDDLFPTVDLPGAESKTLREIIEQLRDTYCRTIGVEFTQIEDPIERKWLRHRMESSRNHLSLSTEQQLHLLTKLSDAEVFEQFIHGSYGAGTKRFSLEGAESMIPLIDLLINHAGDVGVEEVVIGMAHRGRLNVLVNILETSLEEVFSTFEDAHAERDLGGGDVKYHLGFSHDRVTPSGKPVHLTLSFNPSHLEFVNPVVEGRVRAKQDRQGGAKAKVMPLLVHGDAAFIGQGIVPETLNLAGLHGYNTGGTIHVIVNNQIGFTTDPQDSRSTRYASDITRMMKVPVFHVNGEDPEAVAQVATLAIEYRQKFGRDVVIDMYCYRKYGHNEGDEPRYTQPKMYAKIDKKPTVRQVYVERLSKMGQVSESQADQIVAARKAKLEAALDAVKESAFCPVTVSMGGVWQGYRGGLDQSCPEATTSVPVETLRALATALQQLPDGFNIHRKVAPILKTRHDRVMKDEWFDWGTAELLAYASLLAEGTPVRLSGQDVRRGTFSHRHATIVDIVTGEPFSPVDNVVKPPAQFHAYNSALSEGGVLGFEFGYSLDYPDALVVWEAQFGDFLNSAQVIVDQFITSSEDKWQRLSGLVLFLPHGYEGQGPEHSSARIERFLQNSAEDNIQVCNLTTPAQLFHVLRRQVRRRWRKPLIVFTPKSLLRVAATSKGPHRPISTLDDLANGAFQRVIGDQSGADPANAERILMCSGKVYYDLALARSERNRPDVHIIRVEQLYPLGNELRDALKPYRDGTPIKWIQEEPLNYGPWFYINAYASHLLGDRFPLTCAGREPSASPATGSKASHLLEQRMLLDEAFG